MQFLKNDEIDELKNNYIKKSKPMQWFKEPAYRHTIEETRRREEICEKKEFI